MNETVQNEITQNEATQTEQPMQVNEQVDEPVQTVRSIPPDERLDLSGVLAADFAYIAQTAFQSTEDRARTTTFYLLSIGSVLATIFASNSDSIDQWRTAVAFSVVFGSMSILGIVTLLQLARLRSAWFSSVEAMNHIKAFTLEHTAHAGKSNPFPWTNETLPKRFELKSVGAFLLLQVVIMASVMFGACVFHVGLVIDTEQNWLLPAFIGGALWSIVGMLTYFWALQKR